MADSRIGRIARSASTVKASDLGITICAGEGGERVVERIKHREAELHLLAISNPEVLGESQVGIPVHRTRHVRRAT